MTSVTQIEWLQSDHELTCPCCGKVVRNDSGQIVSDPCEHFLFFWDGELGGLEDCSLQFESALEKANGSADSLCDLVDLAQRTVERSSGRVKSRPANSNENDDAIIWQLDFFDHADGTVQKSDFIAFHTLAN